MSVPFVNNQEEMVFSDLQKADVFGIYVKV